VVYSCDYNVRFVRSGGRTQVFNKMRIVSAGEKIRSDQVKVGYIVRKGIKRRL